MTETSFIPPRQAGRDSPNSPENFEIYYQLDTIIFQKMDFFSMFTCSLDLFICVKMLKKRNYLLISNGKTNILHTFSQKNINIYLKLIFLFFSFLGWLYIYCFLPEILCCSCLFFFFANSVMLWINPWTSVSLFLHLWG